MIIVKVSMNKIIPHTALPSIDKVKRSCFSFPTAIKIPLTDILLFLSFLRSSWYCCGGGKERKKEEGGREREKKRNEGRKRKKKNNKGKEGYKKIQIGWKLLEKDNLNIYDTIIIFN